MRKVRLLFWGVILFNLFILTAILFSSAEVLLYPESYRYYFWSNEDEITNRFNEFIKYYALSYKVEMEWTNYNKKLYNIDLFNMSYREGLWYRYVVIGYRFSIDVNYVFYKKIFTFDTNYLVNVSFSFVFLPVSDYEDLKQKYYKQFWIVTNKFEKFCKEKNWVILSNDID